jgi:polysaccharide biosynthesis transport protein
LIAVQPADAPPEMTLRDYGAVIWRRKWLVIVPLVLTTLVATVLSLSQTNMYRATAEVLVREPPRASSIGESGVVLNPRTVENELSRAQGSEIQTATRVIVGDEPGLSVDAKTGSDVFRFTGTSSSAELAAVAANTYAERYIEDRREALLVEYATRIAVLEQRIVEIDAEIAAGAGDPELQQDQRLQYVRELEDLQVSTELARTSGARVVDAAQVPTSPFEPNTLRTALLALVVGLLVGLGIAFIVDYLDTSLKGPDDLARVSGGLPTLAAVPLLEGWKPTDHPHLISREDPQAPSSEAYRGLRTSIQFLGLDRQMKIIQLTSPRPGDGKSTTAGNLAVTMARAGKRVLLIDCDLRKPRVHEFFDLPNLVGFTSVLLGDATMSQAALPVDGEPNLLVMASGPVPPDPSELLSGERTSAALAIVAEQVDVIILDSPPVLAVSDPLVLSGLVDAVVLVASAGRTDTRQVARALEQLRQVDAPLIGTVLNRLEARGMNSYGYGYGYGYGGSASSTPRSTAAGTSLTLDDASPNGAASSTSSTAPTS